MYASLLQSVLVRETFRGCPLINSTVYHYLLPLLLSAVTVSLQQATYSIPEGTTVQVCAELSLGAETPVSVDLLVGETSAQLTTDFTLSPDIQVLTFELGVTQTCVTILANDDSLLEEDEDFTVSLESSNPFVLISPTEGSATVTIPNLNSEITACMIEFEFLLHVPYFLHSQPWMSPFRNCPIQ